MTLRRRLDKLERAHGSGGDTVKVIIWEIVWADGTLVGFHGKALTPTGWKSAEGGADLGREGFEAKLWAMVQDGRA